MSDITLTRDALSEDGLGGEVGDYFALLKPRVMSLVVLTGVVGLVLAPGHLHPILAFTAVLCIAVAAGAAGAINMWYDRDIDAIMTRTAGRPIPSGKVAPGEALVFGVVLAVGSVIVMGLATNIVAALWLAGSIAFYVFVYTMWLKRRTPQNIVIGGAAGAFPPIIGWAAVTGDTTAVPLALFAIIFMWTPPHFWALALYRSGDYARAGVPMLPVTHGPVETRRQILIYSFLLVPLTFLPWALGAVGALYGLTAAVSGVVFLLSAIRVYRVTEEKPAMQLFGYSILYLGLLFAMMLVDRAGITGLFQGSFGV